MVCAAQRTAATPPIEGADPAPRWTLRRLVHWVRERFGLVCCRETIRAVLHRLKLSWKKAKKLLGRADPERRQAFIEQLQGVLAGAQRDQHWVVFLDEAHIHQDADLGYGWAERGQRLWIASRSPGLSARVSFYGLYLYNEGQVRLWPYRRANGALTRHAGFRISLHSCRLRRPLVFCYCELFAISYSASGWRTVMTVETIDPAQPQSGWNRVRGAPSLSEVFGSIATRPTGGFWRIDTAAGGRQALAMMRGLSPDVLVLDVHMPDVDGLAILRSMAVDGRPQSATSVLAVSGDASPDVRRSMLLHGAEDFVVRPCTGAELIERVRRLASRTQALNSALDGLSLLDGLIRKPYQERYRRAREN